MRRKRVERMIGRDHSQVCFKPCGIQGRFLEKIVLDEDEMEAVRLSDFERMYQQEASEKMGISRTTFSRILESAHQKIADALLHGKALKINRMENNHENCHTGENEE